MANATEIEIVMTSDRKIKSIITTEVSVNFNGRTNADYKALLAIVGVKLTFTADQNLDEKQPILMTELNHD